MAILDSTSLNFKLSSKKLPSGKCQVKFFLKDDFSKSFYGYALVDSKLTLKEVVKQLDYKFKSRAYQPYLNTFVDRREEDEQLSIKNFILFRSALK